MCLHSLRVTTCKSYIHNITCAFMTIQHLRSSYFVGRTTPDCRIANFGHHINHNNTYHYQVVMCLHLLQLTTCNSHIHNITGAFMTIQHLLSSCCVGLTTRDCRIASFGHHINRNNTCHNQVDMCLHPLRVTTCNSYIHNIKGALMHNLTLTMSLLR